MSLGLSSNRVPATIAFIAFAGGVAVGALMASGVARTDSIALASAPALQSDDPMPSPSRMLYSAEVLRVIDGDTFEARVRIWPGLDVTTKVRLRNIDAPELKARCTEEQMRAEAARDRLIA